MGKIVQLPKNVINQIAAGEVIERPYSVVKELVENSIDAGALKISVEISNECRNIRVADNGSGIEPEDVMLAFSKHATSKIKSSDDLYSVQTMGFRGEALASIISISKLTCITRTKENEFGEKIECENSEVKHVKTGCAVGTIMEIKDLFYNIPARLKFLKSAKTEFAYINELIQSLALVHSNVSFELKNNGKVIIKTGGQNHLSQTLQELFGRDINYNFKEVQKIDKISNLKISGYISTPDFTRASKKDYYMYVNSRIVKCPVFQKAIDMVYKNLTSNSRYPFIVLNLEIPPEDIDVNVHPTKKEVKYKNPNQIFNFIYSAIDNALTQNIRDKEPVIVNSEQKSSDSDSILKVIQTSSNPETNDNDTIYVDSNTNISDIFTKKHDESYAKVKPFKKEFVQQNNQRSERINNYTDTQQKIALSQQTYNDEDVIIGQYKKTYILIEKENGLEIVDQHIAEERYIYEQLKKTKNIDCQLLFISDVLEVSPSDKVLLETNKEKLQRYGYDLDFISDHEVIFRKVPQILSKISPKEILSDILLNIAGNIDNIEEQILITTSCKAAVKANTYLNQFQMQEIIRNWRTCEKPFTCPHGRPISKIIEHKELAKFFQRNA